MVVVVLATTSTNLTAERDLAVVEVRPEVPIRFLTIKAFEASKMFYVAIAVNPDDIKTLYAQYLPRYNRRDWQQSRGGGRD